jgi:hypothetical protein
MRRIGHVGGAGLLGVIAALAFAAPPARAITHGLAPAASDRRFDAIAGVTLAQWENSTNTFGSGVLIAPDRVILPRHLINTQAFNPASPDGSPADFSIRFRRRPDGTLGNEQDPTTLHHVRVARWIVLARRGFSDDVAIAVLATPVTHIPPMAMELRPQLRRTGELVAIGGWGPDENQQRGTLRLGTFRLSQLTRSSVQFQSVEANFSGPYFGDASRGTPAAPAQVIMNDSGSAVMQVASNGTVRLVGLVTTTTAGPGVAQLHHTPLWPALPRSRQPISLRRSPR